MIRCNNGRTLQKRILAYAREEADKIRRLSSEEQNLLFEEIYRQMIKERLTGGGKAGESLWKFVEDKLELKNKNTISFPKTLAFKGKCAASEAVAVVSVEYDSATNSVDVKHMVNAATEEEKEKYEANLEDELFDIAISFEKDLSEELFIKIFFEVLCSAKLSNVVGRDAVYMKRIMEVAPRYFVLFSNEPDFKKIEILRKAYFEGRTVASNLRDIYTFARATFEQFVIAGLDRQVRKFDYALQKRKTFTKIGKSPRTIGRNGCPLFIDYVCSSKEGKPADDKSEEYIFRTSILSSELWGLLARADG